MAATVTGGVLSALQDDTYNGFFQARNVGWDNTTLFAGKDGKFSLDNVPYFRFSGLNIPAGVHISRATMTVNVIFPAGTTVPLRIRPLARDGVWDVASSVAIRQSYSWDAWLHILDVATTVVKTLTPTPINVWELRKVTAPGRFNRHVQSFTTTAAGTPTTASMYLQKVGSPSGNLTLEIYTNSADMPGSLLFASNTVAMSTVTTSLLPVTFTFVGASALSNATKYVAVLSGTNTRDGTNYINTGFGTPTWPTGPYSGGAFSLDGTGLGFDDQNYPTDEATGLGLYNFPLIPTYQSWTIPNAGGVTTSPDFSRVMQEVIDFPGYVNDGLQGFILDSVDAVPGQLVGLDAYGGATPATLSITWRKKRKTFSMG